MKKRFKPGSIVEIEWSDAAGKNTGWLDIEEAAELGIMDVVTVGFVLKHDAKVITICHSVSEDEQVIAPLSIPTGWIRRARKLG